MKKVVGDIVKQHEFETRVNLGVWNFWEKFILFFFQICPYHCVEFIRVTLVQKLKIYHFTFIGMHILYNSHNIHLGWSWILLYQNWIRLPAISEIKIHVARWITRHTSTRRETALDLYAEIQGEWFRKRSILSHCRTSRLRPSSWKFITYLRNCFGHFRQNTQNIEA